jgi:preprotein translocase subunit YajC
MKSMKGRQEMTKTINDVRIGDRIRSKINGVEGTVEDVDYTSLKVRWDDGTASISRKIDGWVLFVPVNI